MVNKDSFTNNQTFIDTALNFAGINYFPLIVILAFVFLSYRMDEGRNPYSIKEEISNRQASVKVFLLAQLKPFSESEQYNSGSNDKNQKINAIALQRDMFGNALLADSIRSGSLDIFPDSICRDEICIPDIRLHLSPHRSPPLS